MGQAAHYVGNERDVGADLGHFHARPYDYQVGRFLGPDPLRLFPSWGDDASTALLAAYNYTAGNPIGFLDADGLEIHNYDMKQQSTANAMSSATKVDEAGDWTIYERSRVDNSIYYSAHQGNKRALHLDFESDIKTLKASPGATRWKFMGNRLDAQGLRMANMLFNATADNKSATISHLADWWKNEHTVGKYATGAMGFALGVAGTAARGISTPYGIARQSSSIAAVEARAAAQQGATLYRGGVLGRSAGPEGQFWSLENPLSPGFAAKFGIPAENVAFDFVETATLRQGAALITREAPGLGANAGGAIEVVVNPGGVTMNNFTMP